jgi:hypothetical protein
LPAQVTITRGTPPVPKREYQGACDEQEETNRENRWWQPEQPPLERVACKDHGHHDRHQKHRKNNLSLAPLSKLSLEFGFLLVSVGHSGFPRDWSDQRQRPSADTVKPV